MRRPTLGGLPAGAFGALLVLTVLAATPGRADAQDGPIRAGERDQVGQATQPRNCRQVLPSDFRRIVNTRGHEVIYFRDPVRFLCTGDVRLEADSAVVNRASSAVELVGGVLYQDSARVLNADWANYLGGMDQLLARGSTVLRDLEGGAVIRGDRLNYLRATATRPQSLMIVTGGRPHATIPPRAREGTGPDTLRTGAAPDSAPVPTEIRADRMELRGEDLFQAEGSVELDRGDIVGAAREALFDQTAGRMTLTGAASIENEAYRLEGERIDALLEAEQLREVHAEEAARVISQEVSVAAERVRIGFAAGALERLEAWNPDPATAPGRATAVAEDFRLRADSIDARADSVGIREIRAVGRAYGERNVVVDTAAVRAGSATPGPVDRDWIQGDTIHGHFEHVPVDGADGKRLALDDAPQETVAEFPPGRDVDFAPEEDAEVAPETRVALERIVVIGGSAPALSLYRMSPEDGTDRPSINFMKAARIVLYMARGDLDRVEAEGPIEGIYLEPGPSAGGMSGNEGQE